MNIRKYYIITGMIFILVLVILLTALFYAVLIQQRLKTHTIDRQLNMDLSMELFNSSEELTRFARLFVITGKPVYRDMYYEVLDIRNGTVPRPENYSPAYWYLHDESFSSLQLERTTMRIPLNEQIMKGIDSNEEKALLVLSQKNSDHLVLMEERAFAIMKEVLNDNYKTSNPVKESKQARAVKLLFSKEYNAEKEMIMKPIQQFIQLQRNRTNDDIDYLETKLLYILIVVILGVLCSVLFIIYWIKNSIKMIYNPLSRLHYQLDSIIKGEYKSRCYNLPNNEIGFLGEHFNEIADQLEADQQKHHEAEALLRKSEENIRLLVDSAAEAMFGIDMDGKCTFANSVCVKLLGYDCAEDLIGKNIHNLMHHTSVTGEHINLDECKINQAFKHNKKIHADDDIFFRKNGSYFEVEYWSYPLITESEVTGAVVTFIDNTEKKRVHNNIRNEVNQLKTILQVSRVGTWEYDLETGIIKVNSAFREILGYSRPEMDSLRIKDFYSLIHSDDIEQLRIRFNKNYYSNNGKFHLEFRMKHNTAGWVWILGCGTLVCNWKTTKKHVITGTITDITLRKKEEEKILYMANHDALTGLPNRRSVKEKFVLLSALAQRRESKIGVFFIDLDKFKPVNDTYGHEFGDEVLRVIGARLKGIIRKSDMVSRLGGDEFVLLVNDLNDSDNHIVLKNKLINTISEVILYKGAEMRVEASIGCAVYPDDGKSFEELVEYADNSMYHDKKSKNYGATSR